MKVFLSIENAEGRDRFKVELDDGDKIVVEEIVCGRIEMYQKLRLQADSKEKRWRYVRVANGDEVPGAIDTATLLLAGDSEVGHALLNVIDKANKRQEILFVFLTIRSSPEQARWLHLLPWELARLPGDPPSPLVREGVELVRVLRSPARQGRSRVDVVKGAGPFVHSTFASPLFGKEAGEDVFNAAPLSRRVCRSADCGFLEQGDVATQIENPSWAEFRKVDNAAVKMFFGHGEATVGEDDHLKFFSSDGGAWKEERIDGRAMREYWRRPAGQSAERLLALCACDSYRVVAHAMRPVQGGAGVSAPPFVLAMLAQIPIGFMSEIMPIAIRALSQSGDVGRMLHSIRKYCRESLHGDQLQYAFVLFHQPWDEGDLRDVESLSLVDGLTVRVSTNERVWVGFADRHKRLFVEQAEALAVRPGMVKKIHDSFRVEEYLRFSPFRISTRCVTAWQASLVLNEVLAQRSEDQLLPAAVTLEQAQSYAREVGGRLPRPDEWELAAAGPRRGLTSSRIFNDMSFADLVGVGGPFLRIDPDTKKVVRMDGPDPVTREGGPMTAFGVHQVLGNVGEWAVDKDQVAFEMGGRWDLGIGEALPQIRWKAQAGEKLGFRVVWDE